MNTLVDKLFILSSIFVFVYILQPYFHVNASLSSPIVLLVGSIVYVFYMSVVYFMATSPCTTIKSLGYGASVAPILFLLETKL